MKPVNEASYASFTAKFYGEDGQPSIPTSIRWRLRDVSNNRVLQDWSDLATGGTSVDVIVPAALNAIYDDRKPLQEHALSIQAEVGLTGQYTDEIKYKVKNLSAFKS